MGHMGSLPWISLFALIAIAIGSLSSTSKYRLEKNVPRLSTKLPRELNPGES